MSCPVFNHSILKAKVHKANTNTTKKKIEKYKPTKLDKLRPTS